MTVLPKEEIEKINKVASYIVTHSDSVEKIKKRFGLTAEEYEMCMDFAMPQIRWFNEARYYRVKFGTLVNGIGRVIAEVTENKKNPIKEFDDA